MSKRKSKHDFEWNGGLWLPKYGLRRPDRKRPDSRRFMPGYPCCCEEETCCSGSSPDEYEAVVSGIIDGEYGCGAACLANNDTYILSKTYTTEGECRWYYSNSQNNCVGLAITIYVFNDPGNYRLTASVWYKPADFLQGLMGGTYYSDNKINCDSITDLEIDCGSRAPLTGYRCAYTNGTIVISAL